LTTELQASKSSTKSATLSAATSMLMFILRPVCRPLGIVNGASVPPVGVTALASGAVGRSAPAPGASGCSAGRQSHLAEFGQDAVGQRAQIEALSRAHHHLGPAASASPAVALWCTRTFCTVTLTCE